MSLLLSPTSSSFSQANKLAANESISSEGMSPVQGTPTLLTSAPSSCPSAYSPSPSAMSTPLMRPLSPDASASHYAGLEQQNSSRGNSPATRHMTPMGTPISASLTPEELHHHRLFLHHQRTQIVAYEHELLHKFILNNTNKIQSVSRADHKVMVKLLISEAYRNDPHCKQNRGRWERIMRDVMREIDSKNSVLMSIAPDPYHSALAKLSSMLLHNTGVQYWTYRYWEEEMLRRRSVQQATLNQLRGGLFLETPTAPTANKFA